MTSKKSPGENVSEIEKFANKERTGPIDANKILESCVPLVQDFGNCLGDDTPTCKKRRLLSCSGLKWCAGGSGGGGRWVDDATEEDCISTQVVEKGSQTMRSSVVQTSNFPSANIPRSTCNQSKNRAIGNGIFISGGRVMMKDSNTSVEDKITVCTYCHRSFISAHALDVHLSRNQVPLS